MILKRNIIGILSILIAISAVVCPQTFSHNSILSSNTAYASNFQSADYNQYKNSSIHQNDTKTTCCVHNHKKKNKFLSLNGTIKYFDKFIIQKASSNDDSPQLLKRNQKHTFKKQPFYKKKSPFESIIMRE